jgi:hypothetical protein
MFQGVVIMGLVTVAVAVQDLEQTVSAVCFGLNL